jgi:TonB family protein
MVMPVYPEKALKDRVRGLVVLRVLVAEDGTPVRITVDKAAREDLTNAAIEAANQWRFEPGLKNNRPVRTFAILRFPFEGVQFARTPLGGPGAPEAEETATPTPESAPPPAAPRGQEWRLRTPAAAGTEETAAPARTPTPTAPRGEDWRRRSPRPD